MYTHKTYGESMEFATEAELYEAITGRRSTTMTEGSSAMKIGGRYNWTGQRERLIYLGRNWSGNGFWHQFALVDKPDDVWCEVRDEQLSSFEETKVPGPLSELMTVVDRLAARAERASSRARHLCHCGGRLKLGATGYWSCGTACVASKMPHA